MPSDTQLIKSYRASINGLEDVENSIRQQSYGYMLKTLSAILNHKDPKLSGQWLNALNHLYEKISSPETSRGEVYGFLERITAEEELSEPEPEIETVEKKTRRKKNTSSKSQREEYNLLRADALKMLRSLGHKYRRKSEVACKAQIYYNIRQGKLDTKKKGGDVYLSERQFKEFFGLK